MIVQIKPREALGALAGICAVPGVDAVFIGPSDMAASLGHRGNAGHLEVQAAIAQAIDTGRAAGKAVDKLAADGKAEHYLARGATLVGVGRTCTCSSPSADALAQRWRDG